MKNFLTLLAGSLLASTVAFAHSELHASTPANDAVLDSAPKEVMLHFTEAVRLTMLSVEKSGGAKIDLGPLPTAMAKDIAIPAPSLDQGHYVVSWRALSDDGHPANGKFSFTVGAAGHHDEHATEGAHGEHHAEDADHHSEHHDTHQ
jgi:methionine-rich copper-binding protein CopC